MTKKGFLYEGHMFFNEGELEELLANKEILKFKVPDDAFDIGGVLSMPGGRKNELTVTMYIKHIPADGGGHSSFTREIYFDPANGLHQNGCILWSPTEIREMA